MWERILKIKIRGFKDAKRAGKEYAPEAYYEAMILPLDEYRNLPNNEKASLHNRLIGLLKDYGDDIPWAKDRITFHNTMVKRAKRGDDSTMLPDQESTYVDPRSGKRRTTYKRRMPNKKPYRKRKRTKQEIQQTKQERQQTKQERQQMEQERQQMEQRMERRKTRSQMIIDYFTMWRNMYNRLPTLTEITNSEGRPLTVDEERTFNEEYARRTQE
jgi:hypothetical protein